MASPIEQFAEQFDEAVRLLQAVQPTAAEQICRELVSHDVGHAGAWHLLGIIALQRGEFDAAVQSLHRAATLQPHDAEAWNNLGIALKSLGQWNEAIESLRRATELQPNFAAAHFNLANALCSTGHVDEAISAYSRAIELQPGSAEAHFNLGAVFQMQKRDEQAASCYRRALELEPNHAETYANLGTILKNHERLDEAEDCFRTALGLQPHNAEMHYNLACVALAQSKLAAAAASFERVLAIRPDHAEAHFNHATLTLLKGDFSRGWPELEWRWKTGQQRPRLFAQPAWSGEPLTGRTVLLHAEQGLGDTIQFVRYAALVKGLGASVLVECPAPLCRLLSSYRACDRLIAQGHDSPPFDFHAPFLSLPGILQTRLESIPAETPYLFADPALVSLWRERLAPIGGLKIGINWRGRPGHGIYRQRDLPLECFAPLAGIPGMRLISLQQGEGRHDLLVARDRFPLFDLGDDVDATHGAFMDTAAVMMNLDLVITSDTAIAHLAGALGVPVWLALPFLPDWRWLLNRSDSPWYPTMRLFRQKAPGDWACVFQEIQSALVIGHGR